MFSADDLLEEDPRRKFERILASRCRTGDAFALMLVDLDDFSGLRERVGPSAGDLLLYEVTSRLRDKLDERALLTRSGHSEFAVLVRGMDNVASAERLAGGLIERLESPITVSGTRFRLSASIGISLFPRDGNQWHALLQNADAAVFDAKMIGRGRISVSFAPPKV